MLFCKEPEGDVDLDPEVEDDEDLEDVEMDDDEDYEDEE